ncbi:MAG: hypothetical protein ACJ76P_02895, partial [Actinomycetota bacterium]
TVATAPLTYTISVTNNGPDAAEHARINDTIPSGVMYLSGSGKAAYDSSTGVVTWYPAVIEANTTATRTLTIRPIHPDKITNTADAVTSSTDPSLPNAVQTTTTVDPEPGVHYVSVSGDSGFTPPFHSVALGETVQWDVYGSATGPPHDITDSHGLGLFDSGPMSPVNYFRYTFTLSAEIRTMDDPVSYPDNHGKLVIPVQANPSSGGQSDTYTITWAIAPLSTFVEDVQIKRPGDTRWQEWQHGTTAEGIGFVPDAGTGLYQFRDRVRKAGTHIHSRFGPPTVITVS